MKYPIWLTILLFVSSQAQTLTLGFPQSLQYANASNPFLKTYFKDLEISDLEFQKSKVRSNPVFNMQLLAIGDHSFYPQKPLVISRTNRQDWFQLTKKLQAWGQRKNSINFAKNSYLQDQANVSSTIYDSKYDISIKWLNVWLADINMELTHTAARSLDTLIERTAKDSSSVAYLRYIILDDEYDMQYIDAQNDFQKAINTLKMSIGVSSHIVIDTTHFYYQKLPSLDSLMAQALRDHPVIAIQKQNQIASLSNIKLQQSLSVPGPEIGIIQNPQNRIPYTGIFFTQTLPVFDQNKKNIAISKIKLSQNQIELEAKGLEIKSAIQTNYSAYLLQIQKNTQMKVAKKNADKLLAKVREANAKNTPIQVDMWEAETTWFDVSKLYYETEYSLRKAYIDLLYVSGKLE